jgi:haloalkane dehalogenase
VDRPAGVVDFTPDPTLYPFESKWFSSSVGPLHYIDEGEGRPLLLMHGNPDWSFLYRKIVLGLRDEFRCIAPDYPGFGLSVHPEDYHYTAAEHAEVVGELVDHLDLSDMVVVGQDWGGPIGMDIASRRAHRIAALVMGNTWFWQTDDRMMKMFSKGMGLAPAQWLIKQRNFFVTGLMRRTLRVSLSDKVFAHYTDVVPTPESRVGIAEFPKQILDAGPWLAKLERRVRDNLVAKPMVLVFGRKDRALASNGVIARWRQTFPDAIYMDLPDAGHYFQEDAPDVVIDAVKRAVASAEE